MKKIKTHHKILCIVILLLIGNRGISQSVFQKYYTGLRNIGYSISSDNSGFVIAGTTSASGAGGKDVLLMKTDLDGNLLWAKTIGGAGDDIARAIKKTSDGGYIIVGSTSSYVNASTDSSNFYVIKTDNSGNIQWTRAVGSNDKKEVANDVIETYDNKYAVVGFTKSIGSGNEDVYFMAFNSDGGLQWSSVIGSTGRDFGNSLIQTSTHEFIIVGSTTGFSAGGQIPYLIKTSESGVLQNPSYTFGFSNQVVTKKRYFTKIIDGYLNDYVITGSNGSGSIGDAQHFLLNLGQNIAFNWMYSYTLNSGEGVGTSLTKNNGGFIIGGTMGVDHAALVKTDAMGLLQSTKFYPDLSSPGYSRGLDVKPTSDGGLVLVGLRYNVSDTSVYLIKTDSTLSSGCEEQDGFINSSISLSTTIDPQTSTSATVTNYIAIDSGIVATALPNMNSICFTIGLSHYSLENKTLIIQQSNTSIDFLLDDNADFIKSVKIYNVLGAIIKSIGQDNQSISTSELSKGIYFYKLLTNNQISFSGKFIVR